MIEGTDAGPCPNPSCEGGRLIVIDSGGGRAPDATECDHCGHEMGVVSGAGPQMFEPGTVAERDDFGGF